MEAEQSSGVKTLEWQPKGYPDFRPSDVFDKWLRSEWCRRMPKIVNPQIPVVLQTSDVYYKGPIVTIKSKPSAVAPGAPKDSLINYTIYNSKREEVARVSTRGQGSIIVLDSTLTPADIAKALQGAKEALEARTQAYTIYGLYRLYSSREVSRRRIPEAQLVKDQSGKSVTDDRGNIWVISGHFEYPNTQLDSQRSAS